MLVTAGSNDIWLCRARDDDHGNDNSKDDDTAQAVAPTKSYGFFRATKAVDLTCCMQSHYAVHVAMSVNKGGRRNHHEW